MFIFISVLLLFLGTAYSRDWTWNCPSSCSCKWANGKKSVFCNALELKTVPSTLSTEVQVLFLNDNNITTLYGEVFTSLGLINLQKIYLKHCQIYNVHDNAFRNLKILIELDLSDNHIERLGTNLFRDNDRLRVLNLSRNPIIRLVSEQFPVLPHMRSLDLHDCQIDHIAETAFINLELLETLNLKKNRLRYLNENVLQHMKNLKTLMLDDNPWICDCKLRKFRKWYMETTQLNPINLVCNGPNEHYNKQWKELNETSFGCVPRVDIITNSTPQIEYGSNVTFGCLVVGDPLPDTAWELNGKIINNINTFIVRETQAEQIWINVTILNISSLDVGAYRCIGKSEFGSSYKNISVGIQEVIENIVSKTPDTFWYFGVIISIFATIFIVIIVSIIVCLCQRVLRYKRKNNNLKNSISFNEQEKKLLDLSITTNDRPDSFESKSVSVKQELISNTPVISLEPIPIPIESKSPNDEVYPPPPEFSHNIMPNPSCGNVYFSLSLAQNKQLNKYPDLLNISNYERRKSLTGNWPSHLTQPRTNQTAWLALAEGGPHTSYHQPNFKPHSILKDPNSIVNKNPTHNCTQLNIQDLVSASELEPCKSDCPHFSGFNVPEYNNVKINYYLNSGNSTNPICMVCVHDGDTIKKLRPTDISDESVYSSQLSFSNYDDIGLRIKVNDSSTISLPDEQQKENEKLNESAKTDPKYVLLTSPSLPVLTVELNKNTVKTNEQIPPVMPEEKFLPPENSPQTGYGFDFVSL